MEQTATPPNKQTQLKQFLDTERGRLLPILCLYMVRAQLATLERTASVLGAELLDALAAEALNHADQFDPSHQPIAWLLGLASTLVASRQERAGKRGDPGPASGDAPVLSEDEVIDRLPQLFGQEPDRASHLDQQLLRALNHISQEDRRVLRLAANQLDGETLARELGMPPGAARVRLHRALDNLRSGVQE